MGGVSMLECLIDLLLRVTPEVIIVGPSKRRYEEFGLEIAADRWPGHGPLGGIVTALELTSRSPAKCEWNLIVSCDMPFLTSDWLAYLCERAAQSDASVVVPRSTNGFEPLCACWRTDAVAVLRIAFEEGIRKVTDAMKRVSMEVVDEGEWARFDKSGRLFWNMNTPAEYEEARRILESERR